MLKMTKTKRMLIAILLGCVVMFTWGGLSHLLIFIGSGFTPLPNEDKVMETLRSSLPEKGLYFFPGKDFRHSTPGEEAAFEKKFRSGPVGILVYRPVGGSPISAGKLLTQLISNFISVWAAAFITSLIAASYWKRVGVVTLLGGLSCIAVSMIYWNWYEFPNSFFLAQVADMLIGFFLVGLIVARIVPLPKLPGDFVAHNQV